MHQCGNARRGHEFQLHVTVSDELSDILERLRWTVDGYRRSHLQAGDRHDARGDAGRFHFVAEGAVTVHCAAASVQLTTGDFLLAPRGGDQTIVARSATVLHSG